MAPATLNDQPTTHAHPPTYTCQQHTHTHTHIHMPATHAHPPTYPCQQHTHTHPYSHANNTRTSTHIHMPTTHAHPPIFTCQQRTHTHPHTHANNTRTPTHIHMPTTHAHPPTTQMMSSYALQVSTPISHCADLIDIGRLQACVVHHCQLPRSDIHITANTTRRNNRTISYCTYTPTDLQLNVIIYKHYIYSCNVFHI